MTKCQFCKTDEATWDLAFPYEDETGMYKVTGEACKFCKGIVASLLEEKYKGFFGWAGALRRSNTIIEWINEGRLTAKRL